MIKRLPTTIFSLSLGILIFIVLPSIIASFIFSNNKVYSNLLEAVISAFTVFIGYIWGISFMKDIKRVFEYHGAEHKSIYAYEKWYGAYPGNAQKFTTLYPRCGTSFLFIVMFIAIIVFSVIDFIIPTPSNLLLKFLLKIVLRIGLMPIIASLSYELQRYSSRHLEIRL